MKNWTLLGSVAGAALVWGVPGAAQESAKGVCYVSALDEEGRGAVCSPAEVVVADRMRDDILVTTTRSGELDLPEHYPGSVSVVTAGQLEQRQVRDVADVLRDVPGIAVAGVPGQTQIRLRGTEANHVLVLVDGIEVSDPFAGEFDIGTLAADIGARIEVLRGPQSALYGSDAIGGVVAYRTASGSDLGGLAGRIEGGTQGTVNGAVRYGASGNGWDAALSGVVVSTDGWPNARGGTRAIGRDSYTLAAKGSVNVTDTFTLRTAGRFIRTNGLYNDQDFNTGSPTFGLVIDSPGTRFTNEALYGLLGARLETLGGDWTHDLSVQGADIARDTFGPFGTSNASKGDRIKASYVSALAITSRHHLTLAADWEREGFRNTTPGGFAFNGRRQITQLGLVGEYRFTGEAVDLSAAVRRDFNDTFRDATTFRLGAGYRIAEGTRLRAAAGSGIKNPGFFELYGYVDGRFIGNAALRPEKSTGWEIGIDQRIASLASLALTWFEARLEGEIYTTYPPPTYVATPANRTTTSRQRGLEVALGARLGAGLSLDAAYTFLDAKENGREEVRRPRHVASAALTWTAPEDRASASILVRTNGRALDDAFTDPSFVPVRVRLGDYTLVNLNARAKLTDALSAFARVENLLDTRYEQVFSFVSPGRTAAVGVEARF